MDINFNVLGLEELQRKIEAIKSLETNIEIDKALGRGAARMQGQVKYLTPTGELGGTGYLKNSIFLDHQKMMEYAIETNVEYSLYVEFGTGALGDPSVPHTSKESWVYFSEALQHFVTTHGQKPAAMFRQGFELMKDIVVVIVNREVEEIIRNA
jgi:hypothetical protein